MTSLDGMADTRPGDKQEQAARGAGKSEQAPQIQLTTDESAQHEDSPVEPGNS